jgi:ATP-dependent helicase/nuclease subunit B
MTATPTPNVFTIPPELPFALTLAQSLLDEYGDDFVALSQVRILLPNRRSCRAVANAFLAAQNGKPILLPCLFPIGDVNEDELSLMDVFDTPDRDIPAAIAPLERQMILGRLIQQQRPTLPPAQVYTLSAQLGALIDDVHTEGLDWNQLGDLVPADLAQHWQITIEFLSILFENWPHILAERGLIDPADRRNRVLAHYADMLRRETTGTRIIAAGSTGSIPATRDLLRTIAYLPHGQIILSGLDTHMPQTAWDTVPETHAQFYLKTLLDHIGISRPQVQLWPAYATDNTSRSQFLQRCVTTHTDDTRSVAPQAIDRLDIIEATQPQQEAKVVALKIREALKQPDTTILVVTPDRTLGQRITAELGRWDVRVNDAAGTLFLQTQLGLWLQATATLFMPNAQAVALLSMLHHPLAGLGYAAKDYVRNVRWFERYVLRGPRWQGSLTDLVTVTQTRIANIAAEHQAPLLDLAQRIVQPLQERTRQPQHTLLEWLDAHLQLAQQLAATDTASGETRVWQTDVGEDLAIALQDLRVHADLNPTLMHAEHYVDFITKYLRMHTYRPRYPLHPRINILGPIEARLQAADLVILCGLNESVWPRETPHDPFMSQPMREAFGLSPFARRIGQAALDFYLLAHSRRVVLTYSAMRDGTQVAPARWLQQMQVVAQQQDITLPNGRDWIALSEQMDAPPLITPQDRPRFAPPLVARPRQASISDLDVWRRDPYAFYAKKILRLYALDNPEEDAAARDWGTVVHDLLDEAMRQPTFNITAWQTKSRQKLDSLALPVDLWVQWQQRLQDIGYWLNQNTLTEGRTYSEINGTYKFDSLNFTVTGRGDLLDVVGNDIIISDYKTGGAARSKNELLSGYAPQLPFLGLMAEQGGFGGITPKNVTQLRYIGITGKAAEPVTVRSYDSDVKTMLSRNQTHYARLIQHFDMAGSAYIAQPHPGHTNRHNDYAHLERVQEWSHAEGDSGDGS